MSEEENKLHFMLGQIHAEVQNIGNRISGFTGRMDKYEERLERVERAHWRIAGIATAIPTVVGIAGLLIAFYR